MTLRDWVGSWAEVPMTPVQQGTVDALARTLQQLQPRALDRAASSLSFLEDDEEEEGLGNAVSVVLRHATDPDATVELDIWPDQAVVHWLDQTENMRDYCGDDPDAEWPTQAVKIVGDILSGYRAVENTYWRGRWRRTRLLDVRDPANPERERTTVGGMALWWLALTPPGAKVHRKQVNFNVETSSRPSN